MSGRAGAGEGYVRALEIEVRVLAEEGRPPGWISHPDEASLWIYEIAQRIAKDTLDGMCRSSGILPNRTPSCR